MCVCVCVCVCLSCQRSRERDVVAPRPLHRREELHLASCTNRFLCRYDTPLERKKHWKFFSLGPTRWWRAIVYSRKWGETVLIAETREQITFIHIPNHTSFKNRLVTFYISAGLDFGHVALWTLFAAAPSVPTPITVTAQKSVCIPVLTDLDHHGLVDLTAATVIGTSRGNPDQCLWGRWGLFKTTPWGTVMLNSPSHDLNNPSLLCTHRYLLCLMEVSFSYSG